MATYVEFLRWDGRPNDVPKTFAEGGDHIIWGGQLNLITNVVETLNLTIEHTEYFASANYVQFPMNGRLFSWFIDGVTRNRNIYSYSLSMDVLNTYWNDVSSVTAQIERSSSLNSNCNIVDTQWLIPAGVLRSRQIASYRTIGLDYLENSGPNYVISVASTRPTRSGSDRYNLNSVGTVASYVTNEIGLAWFSDLLMGDTNILADLKNILFPESPIDSVISIRAYPFVVKSQSVNTPLYIGTKTYETDTVQLFPVNKFGIYDAGSISLNKHFNDFRDYEPYTTARLFLPYYGTIPVSLDRFYDSGVMNITYYVDYMTGSTIITLSDNAYIRDIFVAEMGSSVVVSGNNYSQIKSRMVIDMLTSLSLSIGASVSSSGEIGSLIAPNSSEMGLVPSSTAVVQSSAPRIDANDNPLFLNTDRRISGRWSGVGTGVRTAMYNQRFNPPAYSTKGGGEGLIYTTITNSNGLSELWIERVKEYLETDQKNAYGKLVLTPSILSNSALTGFVKLRDITLPKMISNSEIRNELYNILTTGFYKI